MNELTTNIMEKVGTFLTLITGGVLTKVDFNIVDSNGWLFAKEGIGMLAGLVGAFWVFWQIFRKKRK
jgi:hypothetical protein